MAESIRSVEVTIVVDTNKSTYCKRHALLEDETIEEFSERVRETLRDLTEVS